MRITTYNVTDRRVIWAEGATITGNENVDKFHFVFDSEWDSFSGKFLVLIVNGTSYIDQLDAENNVILRDIVYDQENVEFGVFGIQTGQESARLSTDIVAIETIESIWGRIRDVSDLPSKTQWEIYTEEMLALLAQGSITLEACQQALTDALSAKNTTEGYKNTTKGYMDTTEGYKDTTKGYMDTTEGYKQDTAGLKQDTINIVTEFNSNVEQKTTDFNNNASSKTTAFNNNASSKTNDFNSNYTDKLGTFNSTATSKTTDFNDNATSKTTTFNNNATSKTNTFNSNATDKTTAFDNNANSKTGDFNDNATAKTTAFNENYQAKLDDFNANAASYNARITDLELLKSNLNVSSQKGTYLNIIDSLNAKIEGFVLCGMSSQIVTTGKNLLDTLDWTHGYIDSSGVVHEGSTNAIFNKFITVNANTSYTVSSNVNVRNFAICEYNSNQEFIQRTVSSNSVSTLTVTTTANTSYVKVCFNYNNSADVSQLLINGREIQFEAGTVRTTYEPYSNGVPSPSPTFEQPIKKVTGNNENVICKKNILNARTDNDIRSSTASNLTLSITENIITLTNGNANNTRGIGWATQVDTSKSITISYDDLIINGANLGEVKYFYSDTIPSSISLSTGTTINATNKYVTSTPSYKYLVVYIRCGTSGSVSVKNLMVSYESDKVFEPYQGQEQLVSLENIELCKIGDYQDYIWHNKTDGKWYKHNVIGKKTYVGAESESWTSVTSALEGTTRFYIGKSDAYTNSNGSDETIYVMSQYFKGVAYRDIYYGNGAKNAISNFVGSGLNHRLNIRVENSVATTVSALKTWLASNNLVVYYVLQDQTDTEITDTTLINQLNAIEQFQTYRNITNAFVTTSNEVPEIELSYLKDDRVAYESQLESLDARVTLLEG